MNILLLSSVYPSSGAIKGTTPVVHYYAREWEKMGHKVLVIHTRTEFPKIYYLLGRLFGRYLYSLLGFAVPDRQPIDYEETLDGVKIYHTVIRKYLPHGRFSHSQLDKAEKLISEKIRSEFQPDFLVGHWSNPQLDLLYRLKRVFKCPSCLVYHDNDFSYLKKCFKEDTNRLVRDVDLVGFRNRSARYNYESIFGKCENSFIAASGVSEAFLKEGSLLKRDFGCLKRFVFVGALIPRKYPSEIISALAKVYKDEYFEITYIGEGKECSKIKDLFSRLRLNGRLSFTGRIPRNSIIEYLKKSDIFVMISKGEVFGLVYLEAMALGCITIASRNEGVDGIIIDGENGFLCEAGNADELSEIIMRIKSMTEAEINRISLNAIRTANVYSDKNVATDYAEKLRLVKGLMNNG